MLDVNIFMALSCTLGLRFLYDKKSHYTNIPNGSNNNVNTIYITEWPTNHLIIIWHEILSIEAKMSQQNTCLC